MPRSFNFLSVGQQIMYTRPCHLVPLCLGGFVEMAQLGAIQLVQIKNFNYFQVFAQFWFQTRYLPFKFWFIGILCFLRPPRLPAISGLHKCCRAQNHLSKCCTLLKCTKHYFISLKRRPPLQSCAFLHCTLCTALHCTAVHSDNTIAEISNCTSLQTWFWSNSNVKLLFVTVGKKKGITLQKRIYELGRVPRRQEEKGKPKPQGHSSKKAGVSGNHQIIRMLNNQANIHQPPCWLKVINLQFLVERYHT